MENDIASQAAFVIEKAMNNSRNNAIDAAIEAVKLAYTLGPKELIKILEGLKKS